MRQNHLSLVQKKISLEQQSWKYNPSSALGGLQEKQFIASETVAMVIMRKTSRYEYSNANKIKDKKTIYFQ